MIENKEEALSVFADKYNARASVYFKEQWDDKNETSPFHGKYKDLDKEDMQNFLTGKAGINIVLLSQFIKSQDNNEWPRDTYDCDNTYYKSKEFLLSKVAQIRYGLENVGFYQNKVDCFAHRYERCVSWLIKDSMRFNMPLTPRTLTFDHINRRLKNTKTSIKSESQHTYLLENLSIIGNYQLLASYLTNQNQFLGELDHWLLAVMYGNGYGVAYDPKKAAMYYEKAIELSDNKVVILECYYNFLARPATKAARVSSEPGLFKKYLEAANTDEANLLLAKAYASGIGAEENHSSAVTILDAISDITLKDMALLRACRAETPVEKLEMFIYEILNVCATISVHAVKAQNDGWIEYSFHDSEFNIAVTTIPRHNMTLMEFFKAVQETVPSICKVEKTVVTENFNGYNLYINSRILEREALRRFIKQNPAFLATIFTKISGKRYLQDDLLCNETSTGEDQQAILAHSLVMLDNIMFHSQRRIPSEQVHILSALNKIFKPNDDILLPRNFYSGGDTLLNHERKSLILELDAKLVIQISRSIQNSENNSSPMLTITDRIILHYVETNNLDELKPLIEDLQQYPCLLNYVCYGDIRNGSYSLAKPIGMAYMYNNNRIANYLENKLQPNRQTTPSKSSQRKQKPAIKRDKRSTDRTKKVDEAPVVKWVEFPTVVEAVSPKTPKELIGEYLNDILIVPLGLEKIDNSSKNSNETVYKSDQLSMDIIKKVLAQIKKYIAGQQKSSRGKKGEATLPPIEIRVLPGKKCGLVIRLDNRNILLWTRLLGNQKLKGEIVQLLPSDFSPPQRTSSDDEFMLSDNDIEIIERRIKHLAFGMPCTVERQNDASLCYKIRFDSETPLAYQKFHYQLGITNFEELCTRLKRLGVVAQYESDILTLEFGRAMISNEKSVLNDLNWHEIYDSWFANLPKSPIEREVAPVSHQPDTKISTVVPISVESHADDLLAQAKRIFSMLFPTDMLEYISDKFLWNDITLYKTSFIEFPVKDGVQSLSWGSRHFSIDDLLQFIAEKCSTMIWFKPTLIRRLSVKKDLALQVELPDLINAWIKEQTPIRSETIPSHARTVFFAKPKAITHLDAVTKLFGVCVDTSDLIHAKNLLIECYQQIQHCLNNEDKSSRSYLQIVLKAYAFALSRLLNEAVVIQDNNAFPISRALIALRHAIRHLRQTTEDLTTLYSSTKAIVACFIEVKFEDDAISNFHHFLEMYLSFPDNISAIKVSEAQSLIKTECEFLTELKPDDEIYKAAMTHSLDFIYQVIKEHKLFAQYEKSLKEKLQHLSQAVGHRGHEEINRLMEAAYESVVSQPFST